MYQSSLPAYFGKGAGRPLSGWRMMSLLPPCRCKNSPGQALKPSLILATGVLLCSFLGLGFTETSFHCYHHHHHHRHYHYDYRYGKIHNRTFSIGIIFTCVVQCHRTGVQSRTTAIQPQNLFIFPNRNSVLTEPRLPVPLPQPLVPAILLSASMNLALLGASHEWGHVVM